MYAVVIGNTGTAKTTLESLAVVGACCTEVHMGVCAEESTNITEDMSYDPKVSPNNVFDSVGITCKHTDENVGSKK